CGGTVKVSRSIHPAVIPQPPTASTTPGAAQGDSKPDQSGATPSSQTSKSRAEDWKCVNPECDNVCFGFRVRCNRCGTGKDGSAPRETPPVTGGGAQPAAVLALRPRLQLGSIRPRGIRRGIGTEGTGTGSGSSGPDRNGARRAAPQPEGRGGDRENGTTSPPPPATPPSQKSNADFRAMLNKK
ncbi:unnamed protein product, partial [Sphacelaria rigidula]